MYGFPSRRSLRLPHFNYVADGYYFITFCTRHHACLLGNIKTGAVTLSTYGRMVEEQITHLPTMFHADAYVVMPNHVHILLSRGHEALETRHIAHWMNRTPNAMGFRILPQSVSTVIARLKGNVTREIGKCIWQRGYYDRIIRNQEEYDRIKTYIAENPLRWSNDRFNPNHI